MKFVSVPGTGVQFCIWETRVKDYTVYALAHADGVVDTRWKNPRLKTTSFTQEETHPVVNVNWNDAQDFCWWLTKKELAAGSIKTGQKYRLPTDDEWSVAVGMGKETGRWPRDKQEAIREEYPWGKRWPPPKRAGNYAQSWKVDNFEYTAPVGSFVANKHGLHDMGGNVREWSESDYSPIGSDLVKRGASWGDEYRLNLYSQRRNWDGRGIRDVKSGFRCVLTNE